MPDISECAYHCCLLLHWGLRQMRGSVYLNCCSTGSDFCWHSLHVKRPVRSSGRTSLVRTTVPLRHVRTPIIPDLRSRILDEHVHIDTLKSGGITHTHIYIYIYIYIYMYIAICIYKERGGGGGGRESRKESRTYFA